MKLRRNINSTHADINELKQLGNGVFAHRYAILTTSVVAYEIYELLNGHSTIKRIDHTWYGSLTSRQLPPDLAALPAWRPGFWPEQRIAAVRAWHADLERQAEALIRAAFPQDFMIYITPVCGHRYGVQWQPDLTNDELADMRDQMCPGCIEEMLLFEAACEEEWNAQHSPTEAELDAMEAAWEAQTEATNR